MYKLIIFAFKIQNLELDAFNCCKLTLSFFSHLITFQTLPFSACKNMGCCYPGITCNESGNLKESGKSSCSSNFRLVGASKATLDHFLAQEERTEILANPSISIPLRLLLNAPFCTFSAFSQNIYLTGIGGITIENLKQFNIKVCRQ